MVDPCLFVCQSWSEILIFVKLHSVCSGHDHVFIVCFVIAVCFHQGARLTCFSGSCWLRLISMIGSLLKLPTPTDPCQNRLSLTSVTEYGNLVMGEWSFLWSTEPQGPIISKTGSLLKSCTAWLQPNWIRRYLVRFLCTLVLFDLDLNLKKKKKKKNILDWISSSMDK